MPSRYDQPVDPDAPNNAHALALELVGWNRRVLELGAAAGHVTRALVDRRCAVTSIEYEPEAARELHGIAEKVVNGDLNDPDVFAGLPADFDVVLAGDVLEHLLDPTATLGRAVQLLVPGGQAIVSLPHVGHVDLRLALVQGSWEYREVGLLDRTHIRFFTLKLIQEMVRDVGFVITDLRRVRVPAFQTELSVDPAAVATGLLDSILADPEAETYQFVFAATRDDGDHRLQRLSERQVELEQELIRAETRYAALRSEAELARDAERSRAEDLNARLLAAERTLARVDASVAWRLFQRVRRVLFAAVGGERSPVVGALQAFLRRIGRILDRR